MGFRITGRCVAPVVVAVLVLVAVCDTVASAQQPAPGWTTLPEMPDPRSELAAAVVEEANHVAGGFGGGDRFDRFEPGTGVWQRLANLPAGLNYPGVAALDGLVYVAGGYDQSFFASDALWAYDPATEEWTVRTAMPEARGALGLVALDGRLFAVDGAHDRLGGPVTGAVDAYDPATDAWTAVTTMPTPREHLAVAAGDGKIWTAGGRANGDDGPTIAGTAEGYDPTADAWEALPALPTPRGGVAGAWVEDRFVTLGGETFSGAGGPLTHVEAEAYDPASGTWLTLPPLPTPRHGLAAAAIGETVYAIAGSTVAGEAVNSPAVEALTL